MIGTMSPQLMDTFCKSQKWTCRHVCHLRLGCGRSRSGICSSCLALVDLIVWRFNDDGDVMSHVMARQQITQTLIIASSGL